VKDSECIDFLQWALPQLRLRWHGYRKVRRQVCKRVSRRMTELGLESVDGYRARLEVDPEEWAVLDGFTRITISRFYREHDAFAYLCKTALPALHELTSGSAVQIWSAGCAGGEEAYTLAIAAHEQGIPVRIVGTDSDMHQLERARRAIYSRGCLKDVPARWRSSSFDQQGDAFVLRNQLRAPVALLHQDIREEMPDGPFHLILCRYLAFTYFDSTLQRRIARRLRDRTESGGFVALGKHEAWPRDVAGLREVRPGLRIYRKPDAMEPG
jgi:chemotaxis protein methyltransferase CheR